MSNDPTDRSDPTSPPFVEPSNEPSGETPTGEGSSDDKSLRRRILIGSQRDPDAYRPKPKRDWEPVAEKPREAGEAAASDAPASPRAAPEAPPAAAIDTSVSPAEVADEEAAEAAQLAEKIILPPAGKKAVPPSKRAALAPDLEDEFEQALAGAEMGDFLGEGTTSDQVSRQEMLETGTKQAGRVVAVTQSDVFIELGGREQGVLPLEQFEEPPAVDSTIDVRVARYNREEGLYELGLPGSAADVGDWADLEEGMFVDARVTGHNAGGLECDVNHIRGFIPVSQVAIWRVEDLSEFVDQKFTCLVTEVNPRRGNLVLSRRAVLEREKEESRKKLWETLAPGQVREGVVRKLMDFGAFVDLGGVDGLLHVSQLSWTRVTHPRDVLQEGQTIKVRIDKVDPETRRISLAFRDMMENPWTDAGRKFPPSSTIKGKVTKLMDFGAFVELEPGVEGLVHVSELAHKKVWRVSDVVNEGDEVEVVVLSVDADAQRISLSMKDAMAPPEPEKGKEEDSAATEPEATPKSPFKKPSQPLKGGLGRSPLGENYGLKW